VVTGVALLLYLTAFSAGQRLLWENSFVSSTRWMFPVICLPLSLTVGLLVKYLRAPTAMSESLTDSIAGDTSHIEWRRLPVSVVQALASLFSGAALGPEGGLGLLASQIAAWYGHAFRIPPGQRPRLIYASVASAYNGLLQKPLFAGVLGAELSETREAANTSLAANLIGGAVGYGVFHWAFQSVGAPGLAGMLGLAPVEHIRPIDALLIVVLALLGVVLAGLAGVFFKVATKVFARFNDEVVRALVAGVIFSVAGVIAPVVMFSGESQVHSLVDDPAHYGVGLLVLMGVAKLALLAVGFRSGFLGGAIFPTIFALVSVALAIDLVLPGAEPTILVAGLMVGFMVVMFRTPFMVILLTGFMLDASIDLLALIVLAAAAVLIVSPLLQRLVASKSAAAQAQTGAERGGVGVAGEGGGTELRTRRQSRDHGAGPRRHWRADGRASRGGGPVAKKKGPGGFRSRPVL
jgi:H+/Cl- antiporter ClcA